MYTHIKGHPRDGLILRDGRPVDELKRQGLVVKRKGEDGAGRRPCADHEVVDGHLDTSGSLCSQLVMMLSV